MTIGLLADALMAFGPGAAPALANCSVGQAGSSSFAKLNDA